VFRREEERIQKVCRCWIEPMLLCACGACHCLLLFVQVAFGGGLLSFSLVPFRRISANKTRLIFKNGVSYINSYNAFWYG
jgi:hypothetical protein